MEVHIIIIRTIGKLQGLWLFSSVCLFFPVHSLCSIITLGSLEFYRFMEFWVWDFFQIPSPLFWFVVS